MTNAEHDSFNEWANQQEVPVGFDVSEAILNSLSNAADAEDQTECARETFRMYVANGVSEFK